MEVESQKEPIEGFIMGQMSRTRCRLKFVLLCSMIACILCIPSQILSWGWIAHQGITVDAINSIPNLRGGNLDGHLYQLTDGVLEPDRNRVVDHINISQCALMANNLAKRAEKMIRDNGDWPKILFTIGQASHYIQDLDCPYHTIPYHKGFHEDFENTATHISWKTTYYDGFYQIKDYKIFAYNTAGFSHKYVKFTYDLLQSRDAGLYERLMIPLWAHSVNGTVHLWLTILKNGYGKDKYRALGFPDPVGTRDDQKIRFYEIKDLKQSPW